MPPSHPIVADSLWLRNRTWDLTFISLSAVLVGLPIATYLLANQFTGSINQGLRTLGSSFVWNDDASRNLVNGLIAVFIGGPHMYATYTRTAFEKEFAKKHKVVMGLSLLIPVGVIYFGVPNFQILLMYLTIIVAFFIPAFHNLDVAFQGFNTWYSFQYLGLTYYINRIRHQKREISSSFIEMISLEGKTWQYYFLNVGLTVVAIGVIVVLLMFREILGLTFDQCYYIVVLSFLLIHYLHDHVLFTQPDVIVIG